MRFVERAVSRPNTCAVIPGRGAAEKEGFIDTGNELPGWDPHIYISFAGAREVARFIGWSAPDEKQDLELRLAQSEADCQRLQEELAEADRFQQNIDGLMRQGYVPKRASGRPPKPKAA